MKKKILSTLLAAAMVFSLTACGGNSNEGTADNNNTTTDNNTTNESTNAPAADDSGAADAEAPAEGGDAAPVEYGSGTIKIWVAENVVDFTQSKCAEFFEANPDMAGYTVTVEPVGEGGAAGNMITDVEGGADIFGFAQDQITRLVSSGALSPVVGDNANFVETQNDAGAASAAKVGDMIYAYPMTSDNGYFLYYDKSVVTDPTSLEKIVADCEAAGKSFYFEINSGWYQPAFFFATGCTLTYDTDDAGNFTGCNIDYASDKGLVALKEITELQSSPAFQNGSNASNATNFAAIVDGTWDADVIKGVFGDNYACAKLPSFEGSDGNTYQLSGFGGFKLLGIKPQTEEGKMAVCHALAQFLTNTDTQLARYEAVAWGPSNVTAQQDAAVQEDVALSALAEQLAYTIPQGNYPGDYWNLATALGDDVIAGTLSTSSSDEDLMTALENFQQTCISYAQ